MVEIADRKELKPGRTIWFGAIDQFERSGQTAAEAAWDLINHGDSVADGKIPKFSADLLFSYVCTCHSHDCFPFSTLLQLGHWKIGDEPERR